jgi:hypothetical protein
VAAKCEWNRRADGVRTACARERRRVTLPLESC